MKTKRLTATIASFALGISAATVGLPAAAEDIVAPAAENVKVAVADARARG